MGAAVEASLSEQLDMCPLELWCAWGDDVGNCIPQLEVGPSHVICGQLAVGWGALEEDPHVSSVPREGAWRSQAGWGAGGRGLPGAGGLPAEPRVGGPPGQHWGGGARAKLPCEGFPLAESPEQAGNHSRREDSRTSGLRLTAALTWFSSFLIKLNSH